MRIGDGNGYSVDRYYKTGTSASDSPFTNGNDFLLIYKDMSAPPSDYFLFQNLTSIIAGFGNGKIVGSLTEGAPTTESSGDPFITPLFQ